MISVSIWRKTLEKHEAGLSMFKGSGNYVMMKLKPGETYIYGDAKSIGKFIPHDEITSDHEYLSFGEQILVGMTPQQRATVAQHFAKMLRTKYLHNMIASNIYGVYVEHFDIYKCKNCQMILSISTFGSTVRFDNKIIAFLKTENVTHSTETETKKTAICKITNSFIPTSCEFIQAMK